MKKHEWQITEADGEKRYFRLLIHGARWTLKSTLKSDPDWHVHDPISLEDYRHMREVLWRKYTRRNCPYRVIETIDRQIKKLTERDHE